MKKAFLDQMLMGFLLIFGIVMFVATVNDEREAKNKYYDLEDVALESIKALGAEYFKNMQGNLDGPSDTMTAICLAEDTTDDLVQASTLGKDLFDNNKIRYVWRDAGTYDSNTDTYDGVPDGRPDTITAVVDDYTKTNFWYKFLGKESFLLDGFSRAVDLNRFTFNVDVDFRGVINAGYYNMVGTYELDSNGCPQNAQLILDNKKDWESKVGETIANIEMPHTRMFFIADGYRRFGQFNSSTKQNSTISTANTSISFDNGGSTDCKTSPTSPQVVLTRDDNVVERSDDGHSSLTSRANVYFQDQYLNFDNQEEHMREIAEKDWGAFVALTEKKAQWNTEAWAYYNAQSGSQRKYNGTNLKNFAGNIDNWDDFVSNRSLSPEYDPDNGYVYISEDLASTTNAGNGTTTDDHDNWNSDRDFTDMSFSMLKIFVPEPIDPSLISADSVINVVCTP